MDKGFDFEWVGEAIQRDTQTLVKYSRDQYSYSPILMEQLQSRIAEGVLIPKSEQEMIQMMKYLYKHNIPLTPRGAGTGNYGQAVPLHGGVVMDIKGLDKILEIGDGFVRVQAGAKMGTIEKKVRETGQELRIFPTTYVKSTAAGFVCGGSGGVGSITWGDLWEGDNVHSFVVYTMEENPQRLEIKGEAIHQFVHSYGTTGIITEIVFPLEPRTEWAQLIVEFYGFEEAMHFSENLARNDQMKKRMVCTIEQGIIRYLAGVEKYVNPGKSVVLIEIDERNVQDLSELVARYNGVIAHRIGADQYHVGMSLSDYSYNHTTLWAMKADSSYTYQQAGFSIEDWPRQIKAVKAEYGSDVLLHFEWIKGRGEIVAACLPIVRYFGKEHMKSLVEFFEGLGIRIYNPHTYVLDDGGRPEFMTGILKAKKENDPRNLLNRGKVIVD